MTTSLESLTLHELEERYNAMRYLNDMKEEITKRKSVCKEDTEQPEQPEESSFIFNLLTSMSGKKVDTTSTKSTIKNTKKKIKVKKSPTKKEEPDTSKRKIKATADDMKETLRKDNIKFKTSILRDEFE